MFLHRIAPSAAPPTALPAPNSAAAACKRVAEIRNCGGGGGGARRNFGMIETEGGARVHPQQRVYRAQRSVVHGGDVNRLHPPPIAHAGSLRTRVR